MQVATNWKALAKMGDDPSSALSLFLVNTEISCERFVGFSISFFGDMYKGGCKCLESFE